MSKELEEFTEEDCSIVYNSIINNKKHIDENKTILFFSKLNNINIEHIDYVLKYSEIYYYHIKQFFNFDKDEKMFYIAKEVQQFKNSDLTCCLQVLDYENVSSIIDHSLTLEHFIGKYKLRERRTEDIRLISDYFFATGHVNTNELKLIFDLMNKNHYFRKIIIDKSKKI